MAEVGRNIELVMPSPKKFFTPAVTMTLVLMVIGFALANYAKEFTANYLALSTPGVFSGRIWQLVTYPFIEVFGWSLVFNGSLLLFVGSTIEREWRTVVFVLLWLVVSVICGLAWVLVCWLTGNNYIGFGASACGFGLIAVFGVLFRRKRFLAFFWALEAQHIAIGLIVIEIILSIPQPITLIWVSGALVAYLYVKLRMRASMAGAAPRVQSRRHSFVDID